MFFFFVNCHFSLALNIEFILIINNPDEILIICGITYLLNVSAISMTFQIFDNYCLG